MKKPKISFQDERGKLISTGDHIVLIPRATMNIQQQQTNDVTVKAEQLVVHGKVVNVTHSSRRNPANRKVSYWISVRLDNGASFHFSENGLERDHRWYKVPR